MRDDGPYDRLWERLQELLDTWWSAREVAPGRTEVTLVGPERQSRVVEIVMTPAEWDQMVTIPWGSFGDAARAVRRSVLALAEDEPYLVYEDYALVASTTPTLPADPDELRVAEWLREHPGGDYRWVALDRDGRPEPEPEV